MAKVTEGMKVRIKVRQASQEEIRNGQYFPHLGGLSGEVQRVYSNTEVAVKIEPESLPADIQQRHRQQEDAMRNRWLESLSDEARNRLTPEEKAFHLNYVVLVAANDLEPFKGTRGRRDAGTRKDRQQAAGSGQQTNPNFPPPPTPQPAPSKAGKETPKTPVRGKPSPAPTSTAAPKTSPKASKTVATKPAATKQAQSTRATKPSAKPAAAKPTAAARSSRQEVKTTTRTSKQPTLFDEPQPKRRTMKELEKAEEQYLKAKKKGRSS